MSNIPTENINKLFQSQTGSVSCLLCLKLGPHRTSDFPCAIVYTPRTATCDDFVIRKSHWRLAQRCLFPLFPQKTWHFFCMCWCVERWRRRKEETATGEEQGGCRSVSKQEEGEDGLSAKGDTWDQSPNFMQFPPIMAFFLLVPPTGIRKTRNAKLWPESPDRRAEAGTTAAHPLAQPPSPDVHRQDGQRQNPGQRGEPTAGAAGGQMKVYHHCKHLRCQTPSPCSTWLWISGAAAVRSSTDGAKRLDSVQAVLSCFAPAIHENQHFCNNMKWNTSTGYSTFHSCLVTIRCIQTVIFSVLIISQHGIFNMLLLD